MNEKLTEMQRSIDNCTHSLDECVVELDRIMYSFNPNVGGNITIYCRLRDIIAKINTSIDMIK